MHFTDLVRFGRVMENFFFRRGGTREPMPRCQNEKCGAALIYEPEFLDTPARWRCIACGWMVSDPKFRKNNPGIFLRNQWIGRSAEKRNIRGTSCIASEAPLRNCTSAGAFSGNQ